MSKLTLHQYTNDPQYFCAKEGQNMKGNLAENIFIRDLIRSNATYTGDCYTLYVSDLSKIDQKLLLSYEISAEDFEWAQHDQTRLNNMIAEYEDDMQAAIDQHIDEVYQEDMEEMGLMLSHHYDNNEQHWVRR